MTLTLTDSVNVPGGGLKVGVAAFWRIIYVPPARSLAAKPLLKARAQRFVLAVNVRRLHTGDEFVGAVPLVVQRIVEPLVAVVMFTEIGVVDAPGLGVNVGAGTCS